LRTVQDDPEVTAGGSGVVSGGTYGGCGAVSGGTVCALGGGDASAARLGNVSGGSVPAGAVSGVAVGARVPVDVSVLRARAG
jgi:hypothetical protein